MLDGQMTSTAHLCFAWEHEVNFFNVIPQSLVAASGGLNGFGHFRMVERFSHAQHLTLFPDPLFLPHRQWWHFILTSNQHAKAPIWWVHCENTLLAHHVKTQNEDTKKRHNSTPWWPLFCQAKPTNFKQLNGIDPVIEQTKKVLIMCSHRIVILGTWHRGAGDCMFDLVVVQWKQALHCVSQVEGNWMHVLEESQQGFSHDGSLQAATEG